MTLSRLGLGAALLLAALVVELSLLTRLPLPGATPDLVLLVVVALGLGLGASSGAVAGFLAGLSLDLVPPADGVLGRWALVLCVVGYLAGLGQDAGERSPVLPVLLVAVLSAFSVGLYAGLGALFEDVRFSTSRLAQMLPTAVLYTVALSPFVVYPVLSLVRRLEPGPRRRRR